jgi:hypothetical protein
MINKGQRVKVRLKRNYFHGATCEKQQLAKDGAIGEVTSIFTDIITVTFNKGEYNEDYWRFTKDELELIPAEEPKYLTKAEALKAAIDGQKIQCIDWCSVVENRNRQAYAYFNGNEYLYVAPDGFESKITGVITTDKWRIYRPPFVPKFKVNQFFTNSDGDYGRVIQILKDGYYVEFKLGGSNNRNLKYAEDKMTEVE